MMRIFSNVYSLISTACAVLAALFLVLTTIAHFVFHVTVGTLLCGFGFMIFFLLLAIINQVASCTAIVWAINETKKAA